MVELQIVPTMKNTHTASPNGVDEAIAIIQNGNNTPDEHLDDVHFVVDEPSEPVPIKRTKLNVPKFLQRQPVRATWRPIVEPKPVKSLGIESICPNVCFFFLRDDCVENERCYHSHELPPDADVARALAKCGIDDAAKLLTVVIARCPKLLRQYFHVFVTFFALQQSREKLIETIAICQRETDKRKQFEYFQQLIGAFIRLDVPYPMAMQTIFWHLDCHKQRDVVDTLLNMNLVDGVGVSEFLDVFDALNKQNFIFNEMIVNRLMLLCTQSEHVLPIQPLGDFARLIYEILRNNKRIRFQKILDKECYNNYIRLYNRLRNGHRIRIRWKRLKTTERDSILNFGEK